MTGIERVMTKAVNAAVLMGMRTPVVVEPWSIEQLREAALEAEERRFDQGRRQNHTALRFGCE
jgi:hypothetical protein